MTLKRIRLELARNKDYPDGSAANGGEDRVFRIVAIDDPPLPARHEEC